MSPHPGGGWFSQTWRSDLTIPAEVLPPMSANPRGTGIHGFRAMGGAESPSPPRIRVYGQRREWASPWLQRPRKTTPDRDVLPSIAIDQERRKRRVAPSYPSSPEQLSKNGDAR
ncbi:hypothetical protein H7J75_04825 [Mycolicibacterium canariasense]|nr:hypothetical protein [Mycolicibacterium canariasense]